ncbi:MAG TPA: aldehyde-activating protein [Allosphingosinicella sp.]
MREEAALNLSCHCGQLRVEIAKRPDYVHECNCTLCRKAGARWGYFHPSEVSVDGETAGYCREDKDDPAACIRFCAKCGVTTHFVLTESAAARHGNVVTGVNMRLADEDDLSGVELRYPDGRAWSGQGGFGYVREPRILGRRAAPAGPPERS